MSDDLASEVAAMLERVARIRRAASDATPGTDGMSVAEQEDVLESLDHYRYRLLDRWRLYSRWPSAETKRRLCEVLDALRLPLSGEGWP